MTAIRRALPVGIVLAVGAGLRLWGLGFGLPFPLARPDEEFSFRIASGFAGGDFNPHFFQWPSLPFYVAWAILRTAGAWETATGAWPNAAAFRDAMAANASSLYLVTRTICVICGVATIALVWRLTRHLADETAAVVAAACLSVAFLHVRDSHFGVLDVPLALLMLAAVAALVRGSTPDASWRAFAWAGFWTGLAIGLKYSAAAVGVAAVASAILRAQARPRDWPRAIAALAVFGAIAAGVFVATTPFAVLDSTGFREGLAAQAEHFRGGHGVGIDNAWLSHLTFSLQGGLGAPLLAAGLAGAVIHAVADWRRALVLWSAPIALYAAAGSGETAFVRYVLPIVPVLCVGAGLAIRALTVRARVPAWTAAVFLAVVAGPSLVRDIQFDRLMTRTDTRVAAAGWLAAHVSPGESLYEAGSDYAHPDLAWSAPQRAAVQLVEFDERRERFAVAGGLADWIVVPSSALRLYVPQPASLPTVLARDYVVAATFRAVSGVERESWFDRQDAFFVPFLNLDAREAPGPDVTVYERRK